MFVYMRHHPSTDILIIRICIPGYRTCPKVAILWAPRHLVLVRIYIQWGRPFPFPVPANILPFSIIAFFVVFGIPTKLVLYRCYHAVILGAAVTQAISCVPEVAHVLFEIGDRASQFPIFYILSNVSWIKMGGSPVGNLCLGFLVVPVSVLFNIHCKLGQALGQCRLVRFFIIIYVSEQQDTKREQCRIAVTLAKNIQIL